MLRSGIRLTRVIIFLTIGLTHQPASADQGSDCVPAATDAPVIVALPGTAPAANVAELEKAYKVQSLIRNRIAERIKWLWREERFLQEDYEYSGAKGDAITNAEVARDLLRVRRQIDALRSDLSRENRAIQLIGERIPD